MEIQENITCKSEKNESGQSLVELAVSLIFMIILLGVIVEGGRMMFIMVTLSEAAKEGAVYASFCPPEGLQSKQLIDTHIRKSSSFPIDLQNDPHIRIFSSMILKCSPSETFPPCSSGETLTGLPGEEINVTVQYYDFEFIMPFITDTAQATFGTLSLSGQARDLAVQFNCP